MKKKLLILGGAAAHCQVVNRAKEMGIHTIVTDYLPIEDAPAKQIADESLQINIMDIDALVSYVKENNVDGVMNFCLDPCTLPAYEVASRCGLRTFGTREQVMAMSDKALFKEACRKYGLPMLESYSLDDVNSGKASYPVLVKPGVGRGSRGLTVCNDRDEVIAALRAIEQDASTSGYVIEDYVDKNTCPFCLFVFLVINGVPYLEYFTKIDNVGKEHNLEFYFSCHVSPSPYLDVFLKNDLDNYVNFMKGLGVQNGFMMFQSFLKDGHFRPVDMGYRGPGGSMFQVMKDAFGIDVIEPMISYAVGNEMVASPQIKKGYELWNDHVLFIKFITLNPGTIGHISGFDKLEQRPEVYSILQRCRVGSVIPPSGDARQDGAHIHCVIKKDKAKFKEILDLIDSTLEIRSTDGQDMIVHVDDLAIAGRSFE